LPWVVLAGVGGGVGGLCGFGAGGVGGVSGGGGGGGGGATFWIEQLTQGLFAFSRSGCQAEALQ